MSIDMHRYMENRRHFPDEELAKYAGKYVAWSPDGTRIVASDDDPQQVVAAIKEAGYDLGDVVISSIPLQDETILGGGLQA